MRVRGIIIRALILGALLSGCGANESNLKIDRTPDPLTVRTINQGTLIGTRGRDNAFAWYGVPYAEAPIGDLRWRAPRPVENWSGQLEALNFSHRCTQYSIDNEPGLEPGLLVGSEDCLYLNVWAPPTIATDTKLPVMVWIHGGANNWGYAGQYELGRLAVSQNVIVVSVNYRLGPLGWFAHEAIRDSAQTDLDKTANFGTLDLIASLDWIGQNIQSFGGDADNVTVFGESAGGVNVGTLLLSPLAKNKFHRGIIQSGAFASYSLQEAEFGPSDPKFKRGDSSRSALRVITEKEGVDLAAMSSNAASLWLRELSTDKLFEAYLALTDGPTGFGTINNVDVTRDGIVIPVEKAKALLSDATRYNSVPVMIGTNRDEVKGVGFMNEDLMSNVGVFAYWPKDSGLYFSLGESMSALWKAFGADEPSMWMTDGGNKNVYNYRFDWDEQGNALFTDISALIGAHHSLEIAFVTGGFEDQVNDKMGISFSSSNKKGREELSNTMMSYWAEFAYSGAPAKGRRKTLPEWKAWSSQNGKPKTQLLDTHAGGGVRMMNEAVTIKKIMEDFVLDTRLDTPKKKCIVGEALHAMLIKTDEVPVAHLTEFCVES